MNMEEKYKKLIEMCIDRDFLGVAEPYKLSNEHLEEIRNKFREKIIKELEGN